MTSSVRIIPPAKNARVFVALYDFHARSPDEMQLRRGDRIEVIERDDGFDDGWYLGRSMVSMHVGLFPKNFTVPQSTPLGVVSSSPTTASDAFPSTPSPANSPASHAPPMAPASRSPFNSTAKQRSRDSQSRSSMLSMLDGLNTSHSSIDDKSSSGHTIEKIATWSPAEVAEWVTSCGFEESIAQKFAENDISGQILLELEMTHLKEFLDIPSFGKRFEVWRDIEALREAVDQKPNTPPPLPASSYRMSMVNARPPPIRQYASSMAPHQRIPSYDRNYSFHSGHKLTSSSGTTDSGFAESSPNTPALNGEQQPVLPYPTIPTLNHQPAILPSLRSLSFPIGHRKAVSAESRKSYVEGSRALNGTHSRGNSADTVRMLRHHAATNDPRSASRLTLVDTTGLLPSARHSTLTLGPRRRSEETARPVATNEAPIVPPKDGKEVTYADTKSHKEMKIITNMPPSVTILEGKPMILGPTSAPPGTAPTPFAVRNGSSAPSPVIPSDPASPKRPSFSKKDSFMRAGVISSTMRRQRRPTALVEGLRTVTPQQSAKNADFSGWLSKRGGSGVGSWKMRFFCVHGTRLSYFYAMTDSRERGLIDINSHRVAPADSNRLMTISQAGKYCFKLTPPVPGTSRGLTFTPPRMHYFAVDSKDQLRAWMGALIKATIGRDESVPVISSCSVPTIPLEAAQELKARPPAMKADLSESRQRQISAGSVESSLTPDGTPELKFCDLQEEGNWNDALRIAWESHEPSQLSQGEESPNGTPVQESSQGSVYGLLQEPVMGPVQESVQGPVQEPVQEGVQESVQDGDKE